MTDLSTERPRQEAALSPLPLAVLLLVLGVMCFMSVFLFPAPLVLGGLLVGTGLLWSGRPGARSAGQAVALLGGVTVVLGLGLLMMLPV